MKICIWGTSFEKVADEAQLLAISQVLGARFPGAVITIFARHGEWIARSHPELRTLRVAHVLPVLLALMASKLFVIVGGPFIETPLQALTCLALFSTARVFRRPVVVYGVTVFPLKTWWGRWVYRSILNRVETLVVREAVGRAVLAELGVEREVGLCVDPRMLLEPASPGAVRALLIDEGMNPDAPLVALTTRHLHAGVPAWVKRSHGYTDENVRRANRALARAVAHVAERAQVVIVPMHPRYEEDLESAALMRKQMSDAVRLRVLSRRYGPAEIMGLIGHSDLLVAGRLGSAIFAAAMGTPTVGIAYEARLMDFMRQLDLGRYVFEWRELTPEALIAGIDEVLSSRGRIKGTLKAKAEALRSRARADAELIGRLG